MVIKKSKQKLIENIVKRGHNYLMVLMLGKHNLDPEILKELEKEGIKTKEGPSLLDVAYHHNWINTHDAKDSPKTSEEMRQQQESHILPSGEANQASINVLNENFKNDIEKLRSDILNRVKGLIQDENNGYKMNALQNLDRPDKLDEDIKIQSKSQLKQRLRDLTKDAAQNWDMIASTEMSNAISMGSVDRIVENNQGANPDEVYCLRLVVNDGALCKECRRFYLDSDGTPKVYPISTLLSNGSNYGKKRAEWKPVAVSTHPNERCSQLIQLKPGWRVVEGGGQEWMGLKDWPKYIQSKVMK